MYSINDLIIYIVIYTAIRNHVHVCTTTVELALYSTALLHTTNTCMHIYVAIVTVYGFCFVLNNIMHM